MKHVPGLVHFLTLFIFLIAIISNCVAATQITLDPIATALDESDSTDEWYPAKGEDSQILLAEDDSDDTRHLILVRDTISPIDPGTVSLNVASAVLGVLQPKQSTVLRL
jgi:hypothetical protein